MANIPLRSIKFPGLDNVYTVHGIENLAPAYLVSETYNVGDFVTHDNALYRCITAITVPESWNSSKWEAANIDSALDEIREGTITDVVRYETTQNLTETQKETARTNIGARDGVVRFDASQTLTDAQKEQARNNIGAGEVDATLTIQGKAADAKATGDQLTGLKADLNTVRGAETIAWDLNARFNNKADSLPEPTSSSSYKAFKVACTAGDVFVLSLVCSVNFGSYAFWDSTGARLSPASTPATLNNYKVVAPQNSAWLTANTSDFTKTCYKGVSIVDRVGSLETSVDAITPTVDSIYEELLSKATINIIDTSTNLLEGKSFEDGYYSGAHSDSNQYSYTTIDVTSGTAYTCGGVRFLSKETENLTGFTTDGINTYTPTYTGKMYVSIFNNSTNVFFATTEDYQAGNCGNLANPRLNPAILAQDLNGSSENMPLSQKGAKDLFPVSPLKIEGVSVADGYDLVTSGVLYPDTYFFKNNSDDLDSRSGNYNSVKIKITPGRYTSNINMRFTVVTDENDNITYSSSSNITTFNAPANSVYAYIASSKDTWNNFKIARGSAAPIDGDPLYNWKVLAPDSIAAQISNQIYSTASAKITGDLTDGQYLLAPRTNAKKNNIYTFMCKITSFSSVLVGHGNGTYDSTYVEILGTKAVVHRYLTSDITREFSYPNTFSISDYLYVIVTVKTGKADIEIFSNGGTFNISDVDWEGDGNGNTYVRSVGSSLTDCTFTWSCSDYRKSVWMYGDSYFTFTNPARWTYYLMEAGFGDNVMLNAFPGEDSSQATIALNNAINNYGKPKFIIWCLGMNDGSDASATEPTTQWMNGINTVLQYCNSYGITPIFATIPSVPDISHEGKNYYVRNTLGQNYRYIDFARAVDAQPNGTWYDGMRASNDIHPSETGAKALFYQAMIDAPEISFSNP